MLDSYELPLVVRHQQLSVASRSINRTEQHKRAAMSAVYNIYSPDSEKPLLSHSHQRASIHVLADIFLYSLIESNLLDSNLPQNLITILILLITTPNI